MARFRTVPEDFDVTELALYEPSGEGEHLYLFVEKRERTTEEIARRLAAAFGVPAREVGFAGRKDRSAVARQWFSVPARRDAPPEIDGLRVLHAIRHRHKLRTGHLAGNRFRLRLREVSERAASLAAERLEAFRRFGFTNRFGAQRFGRFGDNARQGERLWREGARGDRRTARFLISALQSEVFHETLERRGEVVPGGATPGERAIDRVVAGDVAVVHATGGLFVVEDEERERPRAESLEISATGPIFGDRMRAPAGAIAELERGVLEARGIDPTRKVAGIRTPGTRRSLRARVLEAELEADPTSGEALLAVTLEPGVYATVLLAELFDGEPLLEGPVDAADPSRPLAS